MKVIKLAAGFAVGYVLGSRAGREAYEQIAANARQLREHPNVQQAQEKAKALLSSGTAAATAKLRRTDTGTSTPAVETVRPAPEKAAVAPPAAPAVSEPPS